MAISQFTQSASLLINGISTNLLVVESVIGSERLSASYSYLIDIVVSPAMNPDKILGRRATLSLTVDSASIKVQGLLSSVLSIAPLGQGRISYRVRLTPEADKLALTRTTRVHGTDKTLTAIDLIRGILEGDKNSNFKNSGYGLQSPINTSFTVANTYSDIDFVLQYRETNLAFIERICEKYGIYYYYDHTGSTSETMVFCDRNAQLKRLSDPELGDTVGYVSETSALADRKCISVFNGLRSIQAAHLLFRAHNAEAPDVDLTIRRSFDSSINALGFFGTETHTAENYLTIAEGEALASSRFQAAQNANSLFYGESNLPNMRPGRIFRLKSHGIGSYNEDYIIIEAQHSMQVVTGNSAYDIDPQSSLKTQSPYRCKFICMPARYSCMPPRRHEKPRIAGVVQAITEGNSGSDKPALDAQGRYRVRLINDDTNHESMHGSLPVRKVEPFGGGDGDGMHAALVPGVEVMLSFIEGDPDRPVIIGALADNARSSPLTANSGNAALRLRSTAGVVFQIRDGK